MWLITTVPHIPVMLSQPTGHSYAANQMLDHELFNKLWMTTFCLSKKVSAFHKIKFFHTDPESYTGSSEVQDVIHVQPAH
jgi:hypothetical protein